MVMQMGASHMAGSPMAHGSQGIHNIHVKPVHTKPTIHIKHEGGQSYIAVLFVLEGRKSVRGNMSTISSDIMISWLDLPSKSREQHFNLFIDSINFTTSEKATNIICTTN